jgi:hypothetical protein
MPDIPEEAVQAAAHQIEVGLTLRLPVEDLARFALEASAPHLGPKPNRRPRVVCPVCKREVVKRDDGKPITHFAKNHDPQFTCDGTMYSRCRGGCKCRKHQ